MGSLESSIAILLAVTISGNPSSIPLTEGPLNDHSATIIHPNYRPSHLSTSFASDRNSVLQAPIKSEKATDSENLTQIITRFAQTMPQPLGNVTSIATDVGTGLASTASNLEEIVHNANLLADVSDTLGYSLCAYLTHHSLNLQVHPLVKGALSLVNAVDQMARSQPDLDESVEALIAAISAGSQLAKEHVPLKERYTYKDFVVRDMLREIIKGAHIVKVYCEKRPEGVGRVNAHSFYQLIMSLLYSTRPFECEDDRVGSRRRSRWLFPCSRDVEGEAYGRCRPRDSHRDTSYGEYHYSEW